MIVTDIAGREPLVVLTLAEYEQLLDGSKPASKPAASIAKEEPKVIPTPPPTSLQEIVEKKTELEEALLDLAEESQAPAQAASELSLEERFYLEPLDEGQG